MRFKFGGKFLNGDIFIVLHNILRVKEEFAFRKFMVLNGRQRWTSNFGRVFRKILRKHYENRFGMQKNSVRQIYFNEGIVLFIGGSM